MTPAIVAAMPTPMTSVSGSPETRPTTTGSITPVAEIGATMLIVPTDSAR